MAKANAKNKSPSTTAALHPPYFEMIADAISTLKERTGSSQQAIAKFIEDKHKKVLPQNFRKLLSLQLKKFVKSERLFKVKNSYKISSTEKPHQHPDAHETQKSKTATNKTTPPPKQKGAKKKIAEKTKTKRLSQVKTPDALKNKTTTTTSSTTTNNNNKKKKKKDATKKKSVVVASSGGKVKRLSQVKTPEAMKKKPNLTPMKRKSTPKPINSSRPTKRARK